MSTDTGGGRARQGTLSKLKSKLGGKEKKSPEEIAKLSGYIGEQALTKGFLEKCSAGKTGEKSKGERIAKWDQRFFVLTLTELYYFKNELDFADKNPAKGVISVVDSVLIPTSSEPFTFALKSEARVFLMRTENTTSFDWWLDAFRAVYNALLISYDTEHLCKWLQIAGSTNMEDIRWKKLDGAQLSSMLSDESKVRELLGDVGSIFNKWREESVLVKLNNMAGYLKYIQDNPDRRNDRTQVSLDALNKALEHAEAQRSGDDGSDSSLTTIFAAMVEIQEMAVEMDRGATQLVTADNEGQNRSKTGKLKQRYIVVEAHRLCVYHSVEERNQGVEPKTILFQDNAASMRLEYEDSGVGTISVRDLQKHFRLTVNSTKLWMGTLGLTLLSNMVDWKNPEMVQYTKVLNLSPTIQKSVEKSGLEGERIINIKDRKEIWTILSAGAALAGATLEPSEVDKLYDSIQLLFKKASTLKMTGVLSSLDRVEKNRELTLAEAALSRRLKVIRQILQGDDISYEDQMMNELSNDMNKAVIDDGVDDDDDEED